MEIKNISEVVKTLIEVYEFNTDTLAKYLGVSVENINAVAQGNVECLPDNNDLRQQVVAKSGFLYFGAIDDKDLKLCAFLEVLISYHGLSKKMIAQIAGVEISDIDKMLSNQPEKVEMETKYKIAVTVMWLRFFLKDCEPPIFSIL